MAPPAPTSTIATNEDFLVSVFCPLLPPFPGPEVELPDGVGELVGASLSMGITVHTIITIPRAMSPTPKAQRA